jgi:hypothetical protein
MTYQEVHNFLISLCPEGDPTQYAANGVLVRKVGRAFNLEPFHGTDTGQRYPSNLGDEYVSREHPKYLKVLRLFPPGMDYKYPTQCK